MKKACLTPRCPNYTQDGGRCPSCTTKWRAQRAAEGLTGGRPNTASWRRLRRRVLRRDGNRCVTCGSEDFLEVHHVDGNPRNDTYANLVTLCRKCHHEATREIAELRRRASAARRLNRRAAG